MNRKAEIFFDAITLLREDLVEEAQRHVFRKKRSGWRKFGSLAACAVLVVSLGLLAALPRGCGSAMPGDGNTSGAPPAASEGAPSGGSVGGGGTDHAPALEPSAGDQMGGAVTFTAQVLEVLEDGLLVEPLEDGGLPEETGQVLVPLDGVDGAGALRPGDVVNVSCGTISWADGAAAAEDVTEVWLVEPAGP